MPDLAFTQSERKSYLGPILLALAAIGLALAIARHFFPATSVETDHLRTDILPTHTVFKTDKSIGNGASVMSHDPAEDDLYVLTQVRVVNKLRMPIYLDDFQATIVNPDGSELTARGLSLPDMASATVSFPALKPLLSTPLLRETKLEPGEAAQGMILLQYPISRKMWDDRKSATVKIDLYHQPALYYDIPANVTAAAK
jgi:hypothetical protein